VSSRELGLGTLVESLVCSTSHTVRQREGNVGLGELLDVRAEALGGLELSHLDNVDGAEASTVTTSHLLVHASNSVVGCESTELLVHVGGAGARIVSEPDTILGDLFWLLLEDLTDGEDLGVGLFHLHKTTDEVPKAGPRLSLVAGEKLDTVSFRVGITFCGHMPANDFVLVEQSHDLASGD